MKNKAHTAAVRRIAARWGGTICDGSPWDIVLPDGCVDVETSATLAAGIQRLKLAAGRRFVAVTNQETLAEALRMVEGTGIGVMNSQGDILLEADVPT